MQDKVTTLDLLLQQRVELVFQKEYRFSIPQKDKPFLGTISVRGCYGIYIYHPSKSMIIHWDNGTSRSQLDKVLNEFTDNGKFALEDSMVYLVGGWIETKSTGEFLLNFFKEKELRLNLDYFQKKTEALPPDIYKEPSSQLGKWGYSFCMMNICTGEMLVDSDHWTYLVPENLKSSMGAYFEDRSYTIQSLMSLYRQYEEYIGSGAPLYNRDSFQERRTKEIRALCLASRDNNSKKLIALLDESIAGVNLSFQNEWRPLHFACKMGAFDCAKILLAHGANPELKTSRGFTAFDLIPVEHSEEKAKLEITHKVIQVNIRRTAEQNNFNMPHYFAFFSRHPEQFEQKAPIVYQQFVDLKQAIRDPDSRESLAQQVASFGT